MHVWLLWRLRFSMANNRRGGVLVSVLAFVLSSAPAAVLFFAGAGVMLTPLVAQSAVWPRFILALLGFVTTCLWGLWPILSAGVDDHSEVSRYSAFPISSWRLLLASTLASVVEPRSVVLYAPVVGTALGYFATHWCSPKWLLVLNFAAYVFFNAAISRVGLYAVLNVLKQPRSAELMGGGLVGFLVAATFIPAVDASWLLSVGEVGVGAVPDAVIANAALALGRFPTGWFAHGLWSRQPVVVLADVFGLIEGGVLALVVAYGLMVDFHRQSGRSAPGARFTQTANPFATTNGRFSTLLAKEALDLYNNPRARLLVSVPFVLGILLKITSGKALLAFFFAGNADAALLGSLSLYGALVLTATFSQNAFAYDGQGLVMLYAAPQRLAQVLLAKNLVHGLSGVGLALVVSLFYALYFRSSSMVDHALAMSGVLVLVPTLLTAGNFLSLIFPVKFHASLKRKDRLPLVASLLGICAASVGSSAFGLTLRRLGKERLEWREVLTMSQWAMLAVVVWLATRPLTNALLERRREFVLHSVTKD